MPDLVIDFTWYRDPKGYELVPAKLPKLRPGQSILDAPSNGIEPARIVRNGDQLQSYRPLEMPNLVGEFIKMATSEAGVLEFVRMYGPLTHSGHRGKGEVVPEIIDQAKYMARYGSKGLNQLKAWIVADQDGLRLKVRPTCLLDALWLQLAQTNTQSKVCPFCHEPFLVSVGVGRKSKFCRDEHRIKYNSLRRSRRP
jgi:hypothetical protein